MQDFKDIRNDPQNPPKSRIRHKTLAYGVSGQDLDQAKLDSGNHESDEDFEDREYFFEVGLSPVVYEELSLKFDFRPFFYNQTNWAFIIIAILIFQDDQRRSSIKQEASNKNEDYIDPTLEIEYKKVHHINNIDEVSMINFFNWHTFPAGSCEWWSFKGK